MPAPLASMLTRAVGLGGLDDGLQQQGRFDGSHRYMQPSAGAFGPYHPRWPQPQFLGPSLGPRMGGPYGGMGFGPQRGMPPPWCAPPWAMGQDMGMDPFDDIGGSPWDPHEAMFMQSLPHRRPASWPSWRRRRHPPRVPLWYDEEYDDWDDGDSFPSDSDFSPFGRPFDLDDDDDLGGFYRPFARGSELLGRRSRRRWSRRHPRRFFDDPFDSMDDFGGRGWRGRTGARRHGALRPPYAAD